jgi:hypothetical protein
VKAAGDCRRSSSLVVLEKTLWPLILTQRLMMFRKAGAGEVTGAEAASQATAPRAHTRQARPV